MFKNLIIASLFGLSAVILGAFGAHTLKEILSTEQLLSFETAVRYQMYHAIVLLFVAIFDGFSVKQKRVVSMFFYLGIVCFLGSIYSIQLTSITAKSIWFVTPLGGVFLIGGWLAMIVLFLKKSKNQL